MPVIRVEKNQNYTCMSNYHLKEKNMSLKAKGLLSLMLSLPDDWDYSISGLVSICKENETSIKNTLAELKEFGYLEVIKNTPNATNGGRISYDYIVHEKPIQDIEKQEVENLGVESQAVENQVQLNTNILSTNQLSTNYNLKKERKKETTYDEIINSYDLTDEIKELIYEFIKMRKLKKKPLTDRALKIQINKLLKISAEPNIQKQIIEKAITKCWDEFYPITEYEVQTQNKPVSEEFKEKLFAEEERKRKEIEERRKIDLSKYGIII